MQATHASVLVRIIAGALMMAACGMAGAQWWNPQSTIAPGKWAAYGKDLKYDKKTYDQAVYAIQEALRVGDHAKLDRMHDEFLAMMMAGGNGERMLNAFTHAFDHWFSRDRVDKYRVFFAKWRERAPDSKLRPAVEAQMWSSLAWEARGSGYASEVTPEAWKVFRADMDRGTQALKDGAAKGRQSPLWYWAAIGIAGSVGEPAPVLDGLCDEGAGRFPHFLPIYAARLNFLLPQWGGDYDRVDAFIRRAVMRTQAAEGTWLYADLYAQVRTTFHGEDFFRETRASWRFMRHAFEDEVVRGIVDRNVYATFACMARDRDTTRQLLEELGDDANLGAEIDGFSTEACQELVGEGK